MMRTDRLLLISDLHLSEARPELVRAFIDFLTRETPSSTALYILGDLFDVWIGDDDDRPLRTSIAYALKQQADAGLAIYLMHGNRDFLLGQEFANAAGATLLSEPYCLEHRGHRYLLLHGDVLCTQDVDYQEFRTQVRESSWQKNFLARSLDERRAFAAQARARSKSMNSNKAADIMDVTQNEVDTLLTHHGLTTMIHGHTHRPARHEWQHKGTQCRRFVLGDWGEEYWFVALGEQGPELKKICFEPSR